MRGGQSLLREHTPLVEADESGGRDLTDRRTLEELLSGVAGSQFSTFHPISDVCWQF